jgi:hypothetical protein
MSAMFVGINGKAACIEKIQFYDRSNPACRQRIYREMKALVYTDPETLPYQDVPKP